MSTRARGYVAKNNKPRLFYGLYSDQSWVFDQSERAPGHIYIINVDNHIKAINR